MAASHHDIDKKLKDLKDELNKAHQFPKINWDRFRIKKEGGFTDSLTNDPTVKEVFERLNKKILELSDPTKSLIERGIELDNLKKEVSNFNTSISKLIKFRQLVHYDKPLKLQDFEAIADAGAGWNFNKSLRGLKDVKRDEHPGLVGIITKNNQANCLFNNK